MEPDDLKKILDELKIDKTDGFYVLKIEDIGFDYIYELKKKFVLSSEQIKEIIINIVKIELEKLKVKKVFIRSFYKYKKIDYEIYPNSEKIIIHTLKYSIYFIFNSTSNSTKLSKNFFGKRIISYDEMSELKDYIQDQIITHYPELERFLKVKVFSELGFHTEDGVQRIQYWLLENVVSNRHAQDILNNIEKEHHFNLKKYEEKAKIKQRLTTEIEEQFIEHNNIKYIVNNIL